MFDIAWSEMLVIVVVALIVIGPKDLPRLVREVGRWTAKARSMAREFQRSFDDMVREAELDDIRKGLDQARPSNISKTIRDTVDPEGEFDRAFHIEETQRNSPAAPSSPALPPEPAALPADGPTAPPVADEAPIVPTTIADAPATSVVAPTASVAANGSHLETPAEHGPVNQPAEPTPTAPAPADSAKV